MTTTARDIVGRDAELGRIEAAVEAVSDGATRVLLVSGEPGIGKSALLEACAARAAGGGLAILRACAAEQERDVPFALAVEALDDAVADLHPSRQASLDPELGAVLPALAATSAAVPATASAAQRFRLHRGLRTVLEELATGAPVALLLDDLHWADPASLEWVLHALRRPARRPHLIVLAIREVDPLPALLDAARSLPAAEHLALRPLAADAARTLLADVPEHRRDRIVAEAGGNPLYLEGLARSGGRVLPPTVIAAVTQEAADLPPDARALLDGAAVAGDPFAADLAAVAAGMDGTDAAAALDVLAARGLVVPRDSGRLRFRHPLVRRAVYDAVPAGRRIAAHGRLAEALAARGVDAVGRAHHVEQAAVVGDAEAALTLVEAGRASADRSPATAAQWFRAALRLDPAMAPEARAELLVALATALAADGQPGEAHDVLLELLAVVPPDAVGLRLELVAMTASVEHVLGRHEEAARRIATALDGVQDPPPALRARLDYEQVVGAVYAQDLETLGTLAGRSADRLRATEPALAIADEGIAVLGALWNQRWDEVQPRLQHMRRRLRTVPAEAMRARPEAYFQVGYMEYATEQLPEALGLLSAGLEAIRDGSQDRMLAPLATLHALACYVAGDLSAGVESAELAEETARLQNLDYSLQWILWVRALVLDLHGERDHALRLADECLEVSDRFGDLLVTRAGRASVATLHADTDPERAARMIEDSAGPRFEQVDVAGSGYLILAYIRALFALDRTQDAAAAAAHLEQLAADSGLPLAAIRARTARAEVALRREDPDGAVAAAREAVALAQARRRADRDATLAELALGRALAAAGDREAAVAALRDASRRAAGGAMWQLRDTAGRELRRLGSRLDAAVSVASDAHGLTDRERQVADHVAAGRTNKEIAALLFLSPKTIEHTLTRVYAKVGVRSRTGLSAALALRAA